MKTKGGGYFTCTDTPALQARVPVAKFDWLVDCGVMIVSRVFSYCLVAHQTLKSIGSLECLEFSMFTGTLVGEIWRSFWGFRPLL